MRRFRSLALDGVVLVGVLALTALAPLARFAARAQQQRPAAAARLMPLPSQPRGGTLRELPAGLPQGLTIKTPADLAPLAERVLGKTRGRALLALLSSARSKVVGSAEWRKRDVIYPYYPYHYRALDRILAGVPARRWGANATALGAGLIELASRPSSQGVGDAQYPDAAASAFAVLDRARAGNACAPQLDLLLLDASEIVPDDAIVRSEATRAIADCPADLTPRWVLGQYLSQSARPLPGGTQSKAAEKIFSGLERDYPASVVVITGAADAHLRSGIWLADTSPFTARNDFRAAEQGYVRAAALEGGKEAAPGLATALIGLGEPARAARMLRHLISGSGNPGPLLELLVVAEEKEHNFAAAESDAHRLARAGQHAYPDGPALFPAPGLRFALPQPQLPEPLGPLSLGADRVAPLTVQLYFAGLGAGGSVEDVGFIPTYRPVRALTGSEPSCADWEWRRDAVLSGHARDALQSFPVGAGNTARGNRQCNYAYNYADRGSVFRRLVQAEADIKVPTGVSAAGQVFDERQNLWRWAGDTSRARAVIRAWIAASPANPVPELRLGEVEYLQKQYNIAAADFGRAARLTRLANPRNDLGVDEALLDRGVSLFKADRAAEATVVLRSAENDAAIGVAYHLHSGSPGGFSEVLVRFAAVAYYAREQLADHERQSGAWYAAAEDYAAARELLPQLTGAADVRPEALYDNSALTDLALGWLNSARAEADNALAVDPANPAFLMTAGYVADRSRRIQTAIHYDSAALASDSGAYPAANDLGVELARQHPDLAAASALRKAVGARPGYALGWFNLGVLYARMGPAHLLASQGAFGQAFTLNPALRQRNRQLTIDANVYFTGLDLSKPLPPHWSLAQAQRGSPVVAVGLLGTALLAFGLARARGQNAVRAFTDRWVEPFTHSLERIPFMNRLRHPAWALGATVAAFLLPFAHQPIIGGVAAVTYGTGILLLATSAVRARVMVARKAHLKTQQRTWGPGLLFGIVTGAAGVPWAPLPVQCAEQPRRAHLAAPIALSLIGAILFIEAAWLKIPLTESLATASLIMAASTLLPIPPLDGAEIGSGGLVAGAGIFAAAILLGLGIV